MRGERLKLLRELASSTRREPKCTHSPPEIDPERSSELTLPAPADLEDCNADGEIDSYVAIVESPSSREIDHAVFFQLPPKKLSRPGLGTGVEMECAV